MVVSLKANKKRILAFLVLAAIVVGASLLLKIKIDQTEKKPDVMLASNEERVTYLQSFGWTIEVEPIETREVMIPEKFNDVYTTYNNMQKAQGFDLKPYAGFRCIQYKYKVNNHPTDTEVFATLLVYDSKLLGGDLACAKVDGFMHGFAANSAHYGQKESENNANQAASEAENQAAPSPNVGEASSQAPESTPNENAPNENVPNNNAADAPAEDANSAAEVVGETPEEAPVDAGAYPTD
ncbi:DUF4830 domain-containing protein [Scatolibacter rhodanostii]|uniref:DUF4830 domain-containing protein n=1 Tax=Scatolibacter rhodanostii TaxID=2014781 RepID=UPI000C07B81B|nr:DUF4830 domain-containing protein [Scatolibacter rhodanostii]